MRLLMRHEMSATVLVSPRQSLMIWAYDWLQTTSNAPISQPFVQIVSAGMGETEWCPGKDLNLQPID